MDGNEKVASNCLDPIREQTINYSSASSTHEVTMIARDVGNYSKSPDTRQSDFKFANNKNNSYPHQQNSTPTKATKSTSNHHDFSSIANLGGLEEQEEQYEINAVQLTELKPVIDISPSNNDLQSKQSHFIQPLESTKKNDSDKRDEKLSSMNHNLETERNGEDENHIQSTKDKYDFTKKPDAIDFTEPCHGLPHNDPPQFTELEPRPIDNNKLQETKPELNTEFNDTSSIFIKENLDTKSNIESTDKKDLDIKPTPIETKSLPCSQLESNDDKPVNEKDSELSLKADHSSVKSPKPDLGIDIPEVSKLKSENDMVNGIEVKIDGKNLESIELKPEDVAIVRPSGDGDNNSIVEIKSTTIDQETFNENQECNSSIEKVDESLEIEYDCRNSCDLNPEFAVICSFIAKFGEQLDIKLDIEELKASIEDRNNEHDYLIDLHVRLLEKFRKYFARDQWEKVLIRFCTEYTYYDYANQIADKGYLETRPLVKLELLSCLLEAQFEYDLKFKGVLNELEQVDELRPKSLGRDVHGNTYWSNDDPEGNFRIYRDPAMDYKGWKTVCSKVEDLIILLSELESLRDEIPKGEPRLEPYDPLPDIFPDVFCNKTVIKKPRKPSRKALQREKRLKKKLELEAAKQKQDQQSGANEDDEETDISGEEDTPCRYCDKSNDPDTILLCDSCDVGYHMACCVPPLMIIPEGDWYCPSCEHKKLLTNINSYHTNICQLIEVKQRQRAKADRMRQLNKERNEKRHQQEQRLLEFQAQRTRRTRFGGPVDDKNDDEESDFEDEILRPRYSDHFSDEEENNTDGKSSSKNKLDKDYEADILDKDEEDEDQYSSGEDRRTNKATNKKSKKVKFENSKKKKRNKASKKRRRTYSRRNNFVLEDDDESDDDDLSSESSFMSTESSEEEEEVPKVRRARTAVSYRYQEYDELIKSAIQAEDVEKPPKSRGGKQDPGYEDDDVDDDDEEEEENEEEEQPRQAPKSNYSRGKDMAIIEALAYQQENGIEGDPLAFPPPSDSLVINNSQTQNENNKKNKKKSRRLNDLDNSDSEFDDATSDESFQANDSDIEAEAAEDDEEDMTELDSQDEDSDTSLDEIVPSHMRKKSSKRKNSHGKSRKKKAKRSRYDSTESESDYEPRTSRRAASKCRSAMSMMLDSDDEDEEATDRENGDESAAKKSRKSKEDDDDYYEDEAEQTEDENLGSETDENDEAVIPKPNEVPNLEECQSKVTSEPQHHQQHLDEEIENGHPNNDDDVDHAIDAAFDEALDDEDLYVDEGLMRSLIEEERELENVMAEAKLIKQQQNASHGAKIEANPIESQQSQHGTSMSTTITTTIDHQQANDHLISYHELEPAPKSKVEATNNNSNSNLASQQNHHYL